MRSVRPKKHLGQHFLTDLSVARRIADTVDLCPSIPILEVGPGMGVLTQFLMEKQRPLKVVEIDRESVAYLNRHFPQLCGNIIADDFLRMDLNKVFDGNSFLLIGNYPYDISSQIFFRVAQYRRLIPCCTGMIQREVAMRMSSEPGNRAYGVLSVMLQAWYDIDYLFTVDERVFNPPPKVKSAVISMMRNGRERLLCDESLFRHVVKTSFNQRRKMLRGSLKPLLKPGQQLPEPFPTMRPEQLSIEQFEQLSIALS